MPKNEENTASSSGSSLVRPNTNYVYSPMAVDLSNENVVLTMPDISDGRSYVFPFYDLYVPSFIPTYQADNVLGLATISRILDQ